MAIQYDFMNTVSYAAADVNSIRATLSTKGVLPDSVNSCKVVAGSASGKIKISPGTAFFDDGTRITVDSAGFELTYSASAKNYVYLFNNKTANKCEAKAAAVSPSGDYVMLAEVSNAGVITDRREYAKCRIPSFDSPWGKVWMTTIDKRAPTAGATYSVPLPGENYNFFTFMSVSASDPGFMGWYNAISGECFGVMVHNYVAADHILMPSTISGFDQIRLDPAKSGQNLQITLTSKCGFDRSVQFRVVAAQ